jgi:formylmethanofuran dehydrogenase subunit E
MIGVDVMYACIECGEVFNEEDVKYIIETHGLDAPPYESFSVCPYCGGAYANTYECGYCGEWINDDYIKIGDKRYCQNCYYEYEFGEE